MAGANAPHGLDSERTTERATIAALGKTKPFSKELAEWSARAEREIVEWLEYHQYDVVRLPDGQYGPDHLAKNDHERLYVELERRSPKTWESGPFPVFARNSEYITVPERRKVAKDRSLLITVNRNITHGVVVFWQSLLPHRLREHSNRYMKTGELFFFVPYRECLPIRFPAEGTQCIAEMNLEWKREQIETCGRGVGGQWLRLRLLKLQPYGMTEQEWRRHIETAERELERYLGLRD